MKRALTSTTFASVMAIVTVIAGCHQPHSGADAARHAARRGPSVPLKRVVCLFDYKPWLNLDAAGDRDPEGVHYRVYLVPEGRKGVLREGTFHVEMYRIDRKSLREIERTLISDWDYPTSDFQRVKSGMLGMGYHLRLRWAKKDTAGQEIEIITHYKDPEGNVVRSGTKRLRVPQYTS